VARAAVRGRLAGRLHWRPAELVAVRDETATARTLVLQVEGWSGHVAGQHVDVRLTAEDGYSTQRSYSIASAPSGSGFELTIQLLPDGEVSPFLGHDYAIGDVIEVRGPVGGWFVWRPEQTEPVVLVGGGSGVVPLMSMIRARSAAGGRSPCHLVYSTRTPDDVYYSAEIHQRAADGSGFGVTQIFTRQAPAGSRRSAHRLGHADLQPIADLAVAEATAYVCGPTGFVEAVADLLLDVGVDASRIRTERFGPSGG
jgi:ferredoxin-NADP reductase